MAAIEATGLSKRYDTVVALDRVDLVVEEGETFGFLGPNGAGKSTFINILLDFAKPSDGGVSILLGYKSIARERTTGSLHLTLAFPNARRDVVLGKVVGRSSVLLVPMAATLLLAGVVGVVRYGSDGAVLFPWFLVATALYGIAFVGIAIGLSMSTTVDRRITFGAIGVSLLLVQVWDSIHTATLLVFHRFDFSVLSDMPDWALLFRLVKPSESYYRLVRAGFDIGQASRYVGDSAPFFVNWWMALAVLAAWCVVPLTLGFRRFSSTDL